MDALFNTLSIKMLIDHYPLIEMLVASGILATYWWKQKRAYLPSSLMEWVLAIVVVALFTDGLIMSHFQ